MRSIQLLLQVYGPRRHRFRKRLQTSAPDIPTTNPLVVNARAELRDVRRAITTETQRAVANLKNEYELAKAREGLWSVR